MATSVDGRAFSSSDKRSDGERESHSEDDVTYVNRPLSLLLKADSDAILSRLSYGSATTATLEVPWPLVAFENHKQNAVVFKENSAAS